MASMRNGGMWLLPAVLLGLLGLGFHQLFALRFDAGDVYPAYSSFRADPLGAKILFEAFEAMPHVDVEQRLKPFAEMDGTNSTALFLGGSTGSLLHETERDLRPFVESGGRAVLAFGAVEPRINKSKKKDDEPKGDSAEMNEWVSVSESDGRIDWEIELEEFVRSDLTEIEQETEALPEAAVGLPSIPWKSALWFSELGEEWTVLYRYLGKPVVVERPYRKGSLVLLADSYAFCNEAMVQDRHTAFLIRMIGAPARILFDEQHLGVHSQEGVMMLVNRYRLQGVLFVLLAIAGLFVWQRSTSFIPRHEEESGPNDIGSGVGSMSGFNNLLLRHIPQKKLLETMVSEWIATFARTPSMQAKRTRLESELRNLDAGKHPVETYNKLTQILNERK
ncbi:DUF4350 domain-containing protein [Pontiella sp.]|uniref:DUF4350 domain-containing protein n=1 Tax=Pontiella sp. TaxID=2837462 RepID=UPI003562C6E1